MIDRYLEEAQLHRSLIRETSIQAGPRSEARRWQMAMQMWGEEGFDRHTKQYGSSSNYQNRKYPSVQQPSSLLGTYVRIVEVVSLLRYL